MKNLLIICLTLFSLSACNVEDNPLFSETEVAAFSEATIRGESTVKKQWVLSNQKGKQTSYTLEVDSNKLNTLDLPLYSIVNLMPVLFYDKLSAKEKANMRQLNVGFEKNASQHTTFTVENFKNSWESYAPISAIIQHLEKGEISPFFDALLSKAEQKELDLQGGIDIIMENGGIQKVIPTALNTYKLEDGSNLYAFRFYIETQKNPFYLELRMQKTENSEIAQLKGWRLHFLNFTN